VDLSYGVVSINERKNLQKMDKNKSYLLLSGTMDPVGNYVKGVKKIYNKIINLGVKDVKLKLYDGGRHEMLNEINKKEVYQYIYDWIEKRIF
jgi:alpha-beta hydrolase superfamily lysophospholipase